MLPSAEVYMGPKFRILPCQARRAFGPSRSLFSCVSCTQPKPDFLLVEIEWSLIYLQSVQTIVSLIHFLLLHKHHQSLSELYNDAQRTYKGFFPRNCTKYRMASLYGVISNCFWGRQLRKFPRKSGWWDLYPESYCFTRIRGAEPQIFFAKKRMTR
jgi:hypothetical protein